jgi:hypothetical protein
MQHVETIWEGVVSEFTSAYDLICIVDQIQEFAVTQHRDFVIKHLEAWHRRYEAIHKKQEECMASAAYLDNLPFSSFDLSLLTKWEEVKCKSKDNRYRKSDLKRAEEQNALLAPTDRASNLKRSRGRPRLERPGSSKASMRSIGQERQSMQTDGNLKRKGRPRLDRTSKIKALVASKTDILSSKQTVLSPVSKRPYELCISHLPIPLDIPSATPRQASQGSENSGNFGYRCLRYFQVSLF